MNSTEKNIISNLLGIAVFIFSTYSLVYNKLELISFSVLSVIGLGLFFFKASKSRAWINKILGKSIK
tara:strand:+ start:613 stop:813 length:201 start_codon:yes stop_codon:yes gene_type:complete